MDMKQDYYEVVQLFSSGLIIIMVFEPPQPVLRSALFNTITGEVV